MQGRESDAIFIKSFASFIDMVSEAVFNACYSRQAGFQALIHYASDLSGLPNYYSHIKTNEPSLVNLAYLRKKSNFNDL